MADVWGALAQVVPAATTLTDAYTVPAAKRGTVEIIICNTGADALVRLSHAVAAAVDAPSQYLLYDFAVASGQTKSTEQITVNETDVIRAYSDTGNVSFTVNGIQEDK